MAGVEAVGGVFLASHDMPRLTAWYRAIGVPLDDAGMFVFGSSDPKRPDAWGLVFSIQAATSATPPNPSAEVREEPYGLRRVTVNLRVKGLETVLRGLTARGSIVAGPKDYGYGRFAWVHDPDGNVVELWEPAASAK